jgi:hypothetical protein
MIRRIAAIALSVWGWCCLGLVAYYTRLYYISPQNPSRDEYWEGVGLAWGFGLITWLGLPTLTVLLRKEFGRAFSIALNIPVVLALINFAWYWFSALRSAQSHLSGA